jgi:hypothetical protein
VRRLGVQHDATDGLSIRVEHLVIVSLLFAAENCWLEKQISLYP